MKAFTENVITVTEAQEDGTSVLVSFEASDGRYMEVEGRVADFDENGWIDLRLANGEPLRLNVHEILGCEPVGGWRW